MGSNEYGQLPGTPQTAPPARTTSKSPTTSGRYRTTAHAPRPIHPGEHRAEERHGLNISAAERARQRDVPVNHVTQILNGQRSVTADTALRFGHWFGTGPEIWPNLQQLYDLRRARQALGPRIDKLPPVGLCAVQLLLV